MLLNKAELLEKYYTRGNPIDDADVDLYLSRANTWCIGYIGGVPPLLPGEPQDRPGLKIAVALLDASIRSAHKRMDSAGIGRADLIEHIEHEKVERNEHHGE